MASSKEIKRRIKSVKSTKKITKAMELVAASKMKRAVLQTLSSRLYASYSWELLTSLSERLNDIKHEFFTPAQTTSESYDNKKINKNLIIIITSNRGLCGGYNSQIIKKVVNAIKTNIGNQNVDIITIGKKGDSAMRRIGQNIQASFTEMPESVSLRDIVPLSIHAMNEFKEGKYSNVYIAYTDFISALIQKPAIRKILPISREELQETINEDLKEMVKEKGKSLDKTQVPYSFEGDTKTLLDTLAEKLIRMQIYQMFLESNASEQSSRMIAMKNANEAAGEMIDDLTLVFNKARQAGITREISEISAGMASIN